MTDQASIHAAADRIRDEFGRLDVLVNNAGIAHAGNPARPLAEIVEAGRVSVAPLDEARAVSETDMFGVVAVTQALLPLLRRAPAGRTHRQRIERPVVTHLTLASDPGESRRRERFGVTHAASKAALNAVTVAFALDLESAGIKVNAAAPGFTVTAVNAEVVRSNLASSTSARRPLGSVTIVWCSPFRVGSSKLAHDHR